jgi:hypothetical protein
MDTTYAYYQNDHDFLLISAIPDALLYTHNKNKLIYTPL